MPGATATTELDRQDLLDICDKLGPEVSEVRRLVWTADERPGPLGEMVLTYKLLQVRDPRLSANEMAGRIWEALPAAERESIAPDQAGFVARIKRWFQPSQKPYASLNESQALSLAAAAAQLVERSAEDIPGAESAAARPPRQKAFVSGPRSAARRDASSAPDEPLAAPRGRHHIDALFTAGKFPLSQSQEDVASQIYAAYLREKREIPELLCIVGNAYSGKKSILAHVIRRCEKEGSELPIIALLCEAVPYTEICENLLNILETYDTSCSLTSSDREERMKILRRYAADFPAIYIFADLSVLPSDPAHRLITQQDELLELINILLSGNTRTRIIVSCEEASAQGMATNENATNAPPYSVMPWIPSGSWPISKFRLVRLAPPRLEVLLTALSETPLPSLQRYQNDVVDGVTLHLAVALLQLHKQHGTARQGQQELEQLLQDARAQKIQLTAKAVANRLWLSLTPLQKTLCLVIATSDDGLRHPSLLWVLEQINVGASDEEREIALHALDNAFNGTLMRAAPDRRQQTNTPDDLPGQKHEEKTHYEFDRATRVALLNYLEDGAEGGLDSVRKIHRIVAARAREQAHHWRLAVPGVYGGRLDDLRRDVQAVLSLVASIDPSDLMPPTAPPSHTPLDVERAVLSGQASARTVLRFAYLQLWRQDIDRDYRLSTEHAAEELRFYVLLAFATSIGKTFIPRARHEIADYAVRPSDLDRLGSALSGDEFSEFLASLAMAAQQIGAVAIVKQVMLYVDDRFAKPSDRQLVLAAKVHRAYIDTLLQLGLEPNLREVESQVRARIDQLSGSDAARLQAQLKLYLRLGEVCHLQGDKPAQDGRTKRDEARDAFEQAVTIEGRLSGNEECVEGRAMISGYGARRFVRALLDWAMTEAWAENWDAVEGLLSKARDVHVISLRRLTRHAADRAAVLLDEARIHRVEGYVEQYRPDRCDKARAREKYVIARALVKAAQSLRLQPGIPLAVSLDLDGLLARICLQLAEVYEDVEEDGISALLGECDESASRLMRVADRFRLTIHMVHSRVLRYRVRKVQNDAIDSFLPANEDHELIQGLQEALGICNRTGLGLYRRELDGYINTLRPEDRIEREILAIDSRPPPP